MHLLLLLQKCLKKRGIFPKIDPHGVTKCFFSVAQYEVQDLRFSSMARRRQLYRLLQDTLRSQKFADIPFFSEREVIQLLDKTHDMHQTARAAFDGMFTWVLSFYFSS